MTDILTKLAALTQTPRCHRSACRSQDAYWWNPSTREYYCQECALRINDGAGYALCISPVNMPPNSALIALVQEAAAEIERLKSALNQADEEKEEARSNGWQQGWDVAKDDNDHHDSDEN